MQQMPIHLPTHKHLSSLSLLNPANSLSFSTRIAHLWFDQDQVDKQHHKVVLDVFVAEAAAVFAHCQADVVSARLVAAALAP